jgi:hypothetical protein
MEALRPAKMSELMQDAQSINNPHCTSFEQTENQKMYQNMLLNQ